MAKCEYGTICHYNRWLRRGTLQTNGKIPELLDFKLGKHCHAEPVHRISHDPPHYDGPRWVPDRRPEKYLAQRKPKVGDRLCFDRDGRSRIVRWEYVDRLTARIPFEV